MNLEAVATDGDDAKARLRLWLAMLKATNAVEAELRERMRREFATTLPRFDVLAALDRYPEGLRMSRLSAVLRVSNGNVTGIVARLEADGLVARRPAEGDRRAVEVAPTEAGRSAFAELAAAHEAWIGEVMDAVAGEEADRIRAGLAAITDAREMREG